MCGVRVYVCMCVCVCVCLFVCVRARARICFWLYCLFVRTRAVSECKPTEMSYFVIVLWSSDGMVKAMVLKEI